MIRAGPLSGHGRKKKKQSKDKHQYGKQKTEQKRVVEIPKGYRDIPTHKLKNKFYNVHCEK